MYSKEYKSKQERAPLSHYINRFLSLYFSRSLELYGKYGRCCSVGKGTPPQKGHPHLATFCTLYTTCSNTLNPIIFSHTPFLIQRDMYVSYFLSDFPVIDHSIETGVRAVYHHMQFEIGKWNTHMSPLLPCLSLKYLKVNHTYKSVD